MKTIAVPLVLAAFIAAQAFARYLGHMKLIANDDYPTEIGYLVIGDDQSNGGTIEGRIVLADGVVQPKTYYGFVHEHHNDGSIIEGCKFAGPMSVYDNDEGGQSLLLAIIMIVPYPSNSPITLQFDDHVTLAPYAWKSMNNRAIVFYDESIMHYFARYHLTPRNIMEMGYAGGRFCGLITVTGD